MTESTVTGLEPEKWVDKYADHLYRYALARVNDMGVAQDIVQETFISALKAAKKFQGRSTEKTWLFSILRNKIIDTYRAKAKYKEVSIDTSENPEASDVYFNTKGHWADGKAPQDFHIDMDTESESKEFHGTLQCCMKDLSKRQKAVFSMKYLEGLDAEEICKEMGITSSNYWVMIHRAKLALRDCMQTHWVNR